MLCGKAELRVCEDSKFWVEIRGEPRPLIVAGSLGVRNLKSEGVKKERFEVWRRSAENHDARADRVRAYMWREV